MLCIQGYQSEPQPQHFNHTLDPIRVSRPIWEQLYASIKAQGLQLVPRHFNGRSNFTPRPVSPHQQAEATKGIAHKLRHTYTNILSTDLRDTMPAKQTMDIDPEYSNGQATRDSTSIRRRAKELGSSQVPGESIQADGTSIPVFSWVRPAPPKPVSRRIGLVPLREPW